MSGKSSFFVSGICCSSEIPAINSILEPLNGVEKVSINVPNKTVYVHHEFSLISASGIKDALDSEKFDCKILNDAGDAFQLKGTVMSKYVESTFLIESVFEAKEAQKLKQMLSARFAKDQLSHSDTHVPSKTIKIDHNPQSVSASLLKEFLTESDFACSIVADGYAEGIWSAGEDEVEEHKVKLQWNVILSGVFWIVSMLHFIDVDGNWGYLKWAALASVALGIKKIFTKAYLTMKRKQFDTNCMMLFATIGALALQEFSEAAAVTFLFSISDWLETLSTSRARNALSAIVRLRPERAQVKDPASGKFVFVPASDVPTGSIVSVRTGDKIPCDGKVVEGRSVVDESSLTGESRPVTKSPGADVSGGTINAGLAQLLIKTTSTVDDSAVARLIRLVEDAQANRSPTEKLIDEFAKRYTPLVVLLAFSMCTFPWIAGFEAGREWTKIGLVTIVIACPCALIISTPVTYVAGLGAAAQSGIVIKGGAHLEVRTYVSLFIYRCSD
jgi:Cd2+/Zn2+-exporting ATPase